ncbi:MAG: M48 family metalloprotease [Notoacmeibacter sp.]|nr:M48 family metalloprotease [Notoacmeibacter sp.]
MNGPKLDLLEQSRHRVLNRMHTLLLTAGSLGLLGVTAYIFAGVTGVVFAVILGGFALFSMQRVSPKMVLAMYKATPAGPDVFPQGHRIVAELANRAKLPAVPSLHIVPSKLLNAFAVGRPDNSAIAITDALARSLTPRELAGVLAHEMSHIAHEDLRVMAMADIVTRYTSIMATAGFFSLFINLAGAAGGYGPGVPWLAVLLLMASPTIGSLLQLALSRAREFDADLGAAMLTGDPDGLASALAKLEKAQGRMWEGMVLPGGRVPAPSVLRSHPETAERIARLMALKTPEGLAFPEKPVRRAHSIVPRAGHRSGSPTHAIIQPLAENWTDEAPQALAAPEATENPRLRIMRGGVWW